MGFSEQVEASRTGASGMAPAAGSGAIPGVAGLLLDAKGVTKKMPGDPAQLLQGRSTPSPGDSYEPLDDALGALGALGGGLGASLSDVLDDGATALETLRATALPAAGLFDFGEAADFAGRVEELARTIEYLQIVAAQAVERTREEAKHAGTAAAGSRGITGWR
ncbi:hypothetical protein ACIPWF_14055, partial [Paenarthrobacter sp. NPDC089989]